jgi:signal transduction histidine kinase
MPNLRAIRSIRWRWVVLALWVAAVARTSLAAEAEHPGPWRVLILMGFDAALPALRLHDEAFRSALQAAAPRGVSIFTETLDTARFDYAAMAPEYLALTRKKYASQPIDLVVGVSDGAVAFLLDHHAALWPGAQMLFTALEEGREGHARVHAKAPHLVWQLDIEGTLDLVHALQPRARRLIVVGGSSDFDRELTAQVSHRALARSRWPVEAWSSFSVDQLRGKLAALGPGTAVVYTTMFRDGAGRASFPGDALAQLAATSRAPIYGLYGTYMDRGAVAGSVIDVADSGARAAQMAIALLTRQPVPSFDTQPLVSTRCVADHDRLVTLGLSAEALPAGCTIRNLPRNLWAEYRGFVMSVAAVVALQALTIAALLLQRRRRRHAEAEAAQRRLELGRAMRFAAMGELTASIAHEINQPLGAILANAEAAELLLQRGKTSVGQLREILADIRRDDLRAHEVIRRLRALLEKRDVRHEAMRLHPVLSDLLALMAPEAERRGVTLAMHFEALDDHLLGDAVQLQQVLMNLMLNAMDAMQQTAPEDRRVRITTADDGDALVLSVADRGCGIDGAMHAAIFDSFVTTKVHGMGLGLPIVRAIVEAHGGHIGVTSQQGGGAIFTVTLPRRLGPSANPAAGTPAGQHAGTAGTVPAALEGQA